MSDGPLPTPEWRKSPSIRLEVNGPPRVVIDGVVHALAPRDAAILVWLVIEGPTTRSRIFELFWPRAERRQAQGHLRQSLRRLKTRCRHELAGGEPVLRLAEPVDCSVHDAPDPGDNALLAPPRPPVLADVFTADWPDFDTWLRALRARTDHERKRRLERRSLELERLGEFEDALRFSQRSVDEDPGDEDGHRRSMWLHLRRGDLAAARRAFDACRAALDRFGGATPTARTLELLDAIDRGARALAPAFLVAPSLMRPPRVVGRDPAIRAADLGRQAGRPVLLIGPSGVGKSRLLSDLASRWNAGIAPVAARPGDAGVAYSLLGRLLGAVARAFGEPPPAARKALAGVVTTWGAAPSPPATTLQLRQALDAAFDAWVERGLQTLILDDLQFADASSLDWLVNASGRGASAPLQFLFATRPDGVPSVLGQWLDASRSNGVSRVELSALAVDEVAELLDDLGVPGLDGATWAAPLHALSGGVAFDVLNTLIAFQSHGIGDFSEGPEVVLQRAAAFAPALADRLRRLPEDAQRLARIAAIAGQDLDVDLASELLRLPSVAIATPWRALEQAGLFGSAGFVHDRLLDAVVASIPEPVAQTLHRQVAEWLERQAADDSEVSAARIAAHWEAALRWSDAGQRYEAAAASARGRAARREELQALANAVRCYRIVGPDDAARAFDCECRRIRLMPGFEPLDDALAAAEALLGAAEDDEARAAALEARSIVRGERYDWKGALADAVEARRLASHDRVRLLAALQAARSLARLTRHDEALQQLDAPGSALDALEPDERLLWLAETATALDYADRRSEAILAFDKAIEQGRAGRLWDGVNAALNDKAIALVYANRLEESTVALREGIAVGRLAGYGDDGLLLDTMTLATNLRDLGRFGEALTLSEPLPDRLRRAGYRAWAPNAEHDLAGLFLWLGRPELATRALTPLDPDVPETMRAGRLLVQARMLRESTRALSNRTAATMVREAAAILDAAGGSGRSYVRLKIALESACDEEPPTGADRAAAIEAEAERREQHMLALHARVLRVKLLLAGGRHLAAAEAACGFADVRAAAGLYLPDVWWTAAQALERVNPEAAADCVRRAAAWIEDAVARHVPSAFRSSFRSRNPSNLAILAAAGRRA